MLGTTALPTVAAQLLLLRTTSSCPSAGDAGIATLKSAEAVPCVMISSVVPDGTETLPPFASADCSEATKLVPMVTAVLDTCNLSVLTVRSPAMATAPPTSTDALNTAVDA